MKKVIINKEAIQITINKMEGQTTMFIIVGVVSYFFEIPAFSFLVLAACWIALIYLLKSELKNKEK